MRVRGGTDHGRERVPSIFMSCLGERVELLEVAGDVADAQSKGKSLWSRPQVPSPTGSTELTGLHSAAPATARDAAG